MKTIKEGNIAQAPWLGVWVCLGCSEHVLLEPEDVGKIVSLLGDRLWMNPQGKCERCGNILAGWVRPDAA